jgi:UDP-2,3-diacylglucosamine pyrophosphatase LpxH
MSLNRWYNKYRAWRGKEYYSLSKAIKAKVKAAVNFVSSFEEKITKLAQAKECTGVICGHIHTPDNKKIGGLHYLNSGDWVESLSAIVEHSNGRMQLVYFRDFVSDYPMKQDTADLESENTDELDLNQIGIFARR